MSTSGNEQVLEPIGVVSQRRHIRSHANPEVTYEVTQVVRYYPPLEPADGGVEDRLEVLRDAAEETTTIWQLVGEALLADKEMSDFKRTVVTGLHLPVVSGVPHVTVFGTIFDRAGRTLSLTVTDRMSAYEAYMLAQLGLVCWDNVSDILNDGNDANRWNASPSRGTTIKGAPVAGVSGASGKKAAPKTTSDDGPRVKQLVNLDDAETLSAGTRISFPVTSVRLTDKMLHLYGGRKYVYFYIDSADYPGMAAKLNKHRALPAAGGSIEPDAPLTVTVELLDSRAGKRYYKFIDVQL